jgi:hypothetical protein
MAAGMRIAVDRDVMLEADVQSLEISRGSSTTSMSS